MFLKTTYFWPQQVPFCAVFRFTLFVYYLFTWWFVHAHVLLGVLAVCTHTTCTCTAWSVICVYTHNMHVHCLVC